MMITIEVCMAALLLLSLATAPTFGQLNELISHLRPLENKVNQKLFTTQVGGQSTVYTFKDLMLAIPVAADGIAGLKFYVGEAGQNGGYEYGLVNLAAFLAQSMKETIQYDACDENNWDMVGQQYPLANACGQLEQSYQDYTCPEGEEHMQCEVDPNMSIKATTHATWYGAPGPLFCGPKSEYPFVGFWDHSYWCDDKWANPPKACDVYPGQKSGQYDNSAPVPSRGGRTDVEGCCWWGRGVIQTTGICNFGKLNYYIGKRAADEGRASKYPDIDFCKTPDAICASTQYPELKWIAGFFYWMKDVQEYNQGGWYYMRELHKFVNGGMTDSKFIDAISGIVNRGCHNPPCKTGPVDGGQDRRSNFQSVLSAFGLPSGKADPNANLPEIPPPVSVPVSKNAKSNLLQAFMDRLARHRAVLEKNLFVFRSLDGSFVPSTLYSYDTFIDAFSNAYKKLYVGPQGQRRRDQSNDEEWHPPLISSHESVVEQSGNGQHRQLQYNRGPGNNLDLRYGLVNLAAFLAQAQVESIINDSCDETHHDKVDGVFPTSNSCGQYGLSYQDMACPSSEQRYQCPVNDQMATVATHSGKYANSLYEFRPHFYCGASQKKTGSFDPISLMSMKGSFANRAGRTDVKGCCFWGRGAIMTKGTCMLGKLNFFLGAGAPNGRSTLYPDIDFCSGNICSKVDANPTLVWDIGLFEWTERIQAYNDGYFDYKKALIDFVDGDFTDGRFINTVSRIVTLGSANADGEVVNAGAKWSSFNKLLSYLDLKASNKKYRWEGPERTSNGGTAWHRLEQFWCVFAGAGMLVMYNML